MGRRGIDDRLANERSGIHLADALDALVGMYPDDEGVLCTIATVGVDLGQTQDDCFDLGDLHGVTELLPRDYPGPRRLTGAP